MDRLEGWMCRMCSGALVMPLALPACSLHQVGRALCNTAAAAHDVPTSVATLHGRGEQGGGA